MGSGWVRDRARFGQYTLEDKIAGGGTGGKPAPGHELLRRPTALKLLHPDRIGATTLDRFEREVQEMSKLTHPNTVSVYADYGHSLDGIFYCAMEFLDGVTLDRLVRAHGPQPAGRVIDILVQVCGALDEAHERSLVHRDVKPANIILCERGGQPDVARVVDFGLGIVGTPGYMAPEAIATPRSVTAAADVYTLGMVACFLLTGRPHAEASPADTALSAVILECLAEDPAKRPSARALADKLRAIRGDDWDVRAARAWWRAFHSDRRNELEPAAGTMRITVDLDSRED